MKNKRLFYNKTAKGLASLITIIVLLTSILAGSILYQNNITANAVKETSINDKPSTISIKEVNDINELSQLNEGKYLIKDGFVYYADDYNNIPLYIKVKNPEQQNGLFVVDSDGNIEFSNDYNELNEKSNENKITGQATGLEKVSGFQTTQTGSGVAGRMIVNNDDKPATQTIDGVSVTIPPKSAYDKLKGISIPLGTSQQTAGKPGKSKAVFLRAIVTDKGTVPVYIFEADTNGFQTIEIDDKRYMVHQSLLKGALFDKWDKDSLSIDTIPISGGTKKIDFDLGGRAISSIDVTKDSKGTITKRTTTTLAVEGDKFTGGLEEKIEDLVKRQTITTITLPDKSQIKKESKIGSDELATITVTVDGKTSQFKGEAFKSLESVTNNNKDKINQLLIEAARAGISLDKFEQGIIGDQNGNHLRYDNINIFVMNGKNVISSINAEGYYTKYYGEVNIDPNLNELTYIGESGYNTYDKNNNLIHSYFKVGDKAYKSFYTKEGITIDDTKIKIDPKFGYDPNDIQNYGKLKVYGILGCENGCIFEPGATVFGLFESYLPSKLYTVDATGEKKPISTTPEQLALIEKAGDIQRVYGQRGSVGVTGRQLKSQQFFAGVERIFTEFQGLAYLPTLFMDQDSLLKWRDNVDRIFATLYLGTEYWSSSICGSYLDGEGEGIAYAETPQGLAQIGAHVEATRTSPLINEKGEKEFIYKITFNVRNGDYDKDPRAPEEMKVNLILKGQKTVNVFKDDIKIDRGDTFGRVGSSAIVQDSKTLFTEICLKFDQIPLRWKLDNNELCNAIQQSSSSPTSVKGQTSQNLGTSAGAQSVAEINDF